MANNNWMDKNSGFLDLARNYIIISWILSAWRPLCFAFGTVLVLSVIVARPIHSGYVLAVGLILLIPTFITVAGLVRDEVHESQMQLRAREAFEEDEILNNKYLARCKKYGSSYEFTDDPNPEEKVRDLSRKPTFGGVADLSEPESPPRLPKSISVSSDNIWYYTQDKEAYGPISYSELNKLIKTGVLTKKDRIWRSGVRDWMKPRL